MAEEHDFPFPYLHDEDQSVARAYDAGENQVVYTRLAADLDTPVSLMLKLTGAQKDAFMLESVTGGEVRGRYSIIGMKPDLVWRCHGETSALSTKVVVFGYTINHVQYRLAHNRPSLPGANLNYRHYVLRT